MDLNSMKYADLRQLAKNAGLKANVKADKLLKALKRHFEQQETSENGNTVTLADVQIPQEAAAEPKPANDALVTTRRGKNQQAKRKYSGEAAGPSPKPDDDPAEDEGGDKKGPKKRKVSSGKDKESPAPQTNPEPTDQRAGTEEISKGVGKKTAGKIPRHKGLMNKKSALRPTTPNFKKLHEAHFNKMESIDSYVQRRTKQMEVLRSSVKDLKAQSENGSRKSADANARAKPQVIRATLFSPGVPEKKTEKRVVTHASASKSAMKDSAPFRPSIISTNKINVRFSKATQDNEHKRSLVKTPSRISPMIPLTPTPGRKSTTCTNKNGAVNKTPGSTPFIFSGASGTPNTNKKNAFDLKASLSRPLSYKPHKGKLQPFGGTMENELNKSQTVPSHQKNYKQHQVQTRDERRVKHNEDRKKKKEAVLGARRGLVMA